MFLLLALGILALSWALVAAQEVIRLSQNVPGDSKPIILHADAITTWTEGGWRVILLKGTVLVEHGVVQARCQQAVAWLDQARFRQTGVMRLELYAEGVVQLERGAEQRSGPEAILELHTRGEVKLKAHNSKVSQVPQPEDVLYQRAHLVRGPQAAPLATEAVQQTSAREPAATPTPPRAAGQPVQNPPSVPGPRTTLPLSPPPLAGTPVGPGVPGTLPPPGPLPSPQPSVAPRASGVLPPTAPVPPPSNPVPQSALPGTVPGPTRAPGPAPAPPSGPPPRAAPRTLLDTGGARQFSIRPRTTTGLDVQTAPLANGEQAFIVTGGIILNVRLGDGSGLLDIEADRLVFWTQGQAPGLLNSLQQFDGQSNQVREFYLAGNVEIRQKDAKEERTLRADEVYYDVGRHVAVAVRGDLEFRQPGIPDPVHLRAEELLQLSETQFKGVRAEVFSSRLPSDPGIKVLVAEASIENKEILKRSIFGRQVLDRQTGQPQTEPQRLFHGSNVFLKVEDVPIFYLPFLQGDANDPLGPLESISLGYNRIFGFQAAATFNVYDLLGIDPLPGTRWRADVDYLSRRGPALGTNFEYFGTTFFELPARLNGLVKAYGIHDTGTDILGGGRGENEHHTEWRGRFLWRQNVQGLPEGFSLQSQVSALSDKNFLEQFYKIEFDQDINQETFLYLKQQQDNWAWTVLTKPRIRNWVTETEWLPRADGYLLGQSFFDLFTYNVHVSAGYAQLKPTELPPPPVLSTDQGISTSRFDLTQELSLPFDAGPVRMVPYVVLDLTHYTDDLTGSERGRFYGGGGVRGSVPLTRLYPDIQSALLNLNGINHKIVLGGNYYNVHSDTRFNRLPQLDRLDDDATDQARRDIRLAQPFLDQTPGSVLASSPLYDPQRYAIRRLVESRIDTRDTIEVFQADIRQRLQTKRGYPGLQHIVDWMILDLSGSFFPNADRDNFGQQAAFLEYDWTWNLGDRTSLVSTGWIDPIEDGARVFTIGAYLDRPDRTNFFLGYRSIDPLESQAVTGAVTYIFSPKYALTTSVLYDFGVETQVTSFTITRMGSDLQVSLGFTYNSTQNNFGFTLELLPNIGIQSRRVAALPMLGPGAMGR